MIQKMILSLALGLLKRLNLDAILKPLLETLIKSSENVVEKLLNVVEIVDDVILDRLEEIAPETARRFQEVLLRLFAKINERLEN